MNHKLNLGPFLNPVPLAEEAGRNVRDKDQLQQLISKFFLLNEKVVVVRQLMAEGLEKEEEIKSTLDVPEHVILNTQRELRHRQELKQDNEVLPTLKLADLQKPSTRQFTLTNCIDKNGKTFRQYHVGIEEDINFYRLVFNFDGVDSEFLKKIMLWVYVMNRSIGTASFTANELTSKLSLHTSGFNVFTAPGV